MIHRTITDSNQLVEHCFKNTIVSIFIKSSGSNLDIDNCSFPAISSEGIIPNDVSIAVDHRYIQQSIRYVSGILIFGNPQS